MADDEKEETIAEENLALESAGDVFLNGDANGDAACPAEENGEEEEEEEDEDENGIIDSLPESVLPRRSSLMKKDAASRRPKRKKTVSFSSVDKKIATGKENISPQCVFQSFFSFILRFKHSVTPASAVSSGCGAAK